VRHAALVENKPRYFSYLLRVWLAEEGSQPQWRASLEDTLTGERLGFARLDDLCQYLKQQTQLKTGEKEAN
jgi:hypothetical protein